VKSDDKNLTDKPATLSEADISSQRVSRRSMLASLGIGAGVAAGAIVAATSVAHARESDGGGYGRSCGNGCSDSDNPNSRYGDPAGYGRCNRRRGCTDND
jgi:hypothetical protein